MEAPEVPLEQVHEHIHHQAHHGTARETRWVSGVALSTAIIAALAALASMMAGHSETEAMHSKMDSNDQWSLFQAKSLKEHALENTDAVLIALGKTPAPADGERIATYQAEEEHAHDQAEAFNHVSEAYLGVHEKFAFAVTLFQIAIALSAISALTKRRRYWLFSLVIGAAGVGCAGYGLMLNTSAHPHGAAAVADTGGHGG